MSDDEQKSSKNEGHLLSIPKFVFCKEFWEEVWKNFKELIPVCIVVIANVIFVIIENVFSHDIEEVSELIEWCNYFSIISSTVWSLIVSSYGIYNDMKRPRKNSFWFVMAIINGSVCFLIYAFCMSYRPFVINNDYFNVSSYHTFVCFLQVFGFTSLFVQLFYSLFAGISRSEITDRYNDRCNRTEKFAPPATSDYETEERK